MGRNNNNKYNLVHVFSCADFFYTLKGLSTEIENNFVKMWTEIGTLLFLHFMSIA